MNRLEGRFAAGQIPGGREYQEDDYGLIERGDADEDGGEVLVLADGMGGHVSGDTASRAVVKTFVETYPGTDGPITDRLRACLAAANDALADATSENPRNEGDGVDGGRGGRFRRDGLDWISVGDSPLWLFRGRPVAPPQCRSLHGACPRQPRSGRAHDRGTGGDGFQAACPAVRRDGRGDPPG